MMRSRRENLEGLVGRHDLNAGANDVDLGLAFRERPLEPAELLLAEKILGGVEGATIKEDHANLGG